MRTRRGERVPGTLKGKHTIVGVVFFQGFSWLVTFETGRDGNIRDGTGRYCFDMFAGKKIEDGTGRDRTGQDGKIMKNIVAWMGRDGTVGVNFLGGTGR